jgi:hypothetical protein
MRDRTFGTRGWFVLLAVGLLFGCNAEDEPEVRSTRQASIQGASGHVIFAHHSLLLKQNAVVTGKVSARDQSAGPYAGDSAEVTVGLSVSTTGDVAGDTVRLKSGASVFSDVHSNELVQGSNATITGTHVTPLSLPLPDITPPIPTFSAGTQDVTVTG